MSNIKSPTEIFPVRLKSSRELRGLDQSGLAKSAGLPPSSISHFESGSRKPSFENLWKLANALGVSTDYLLGRVDETNHHQANTDPLFRDLEKLNDASDRKLAADFMQMLAARRES